MSQRVHVAVFEREADLLQGIGELRALGLQTVDAFTPYPVHGIAAALGLRRSRLPIVCFLAGLTGALVGLGLQYWTAGVDWPLNVGGKPLDSLPAFLPVVFELMVLFAGLATAFFLCMRSSLYPGRKVQALAKRVTDDRFAVVAMAPGAAVTEESVEEVLARTHAVEHHRPFLEDPA